MDRTKSQSTTSKQRGLVLIVVVLTAVLSAMFFHAFLPGNVLFSNDGPLGAQHAESHRLPGLFKGAWEDLNSVGYRAVSASPNLTNTFFLLLGPFGYSKFFAAIALFILGMGAWCYFRQVGLSPVACVLGAVAAVLNSNFFSVACWGVATQAITVGLVFFALAALADTTSSRRWLRLVLGGLLVGMAVSDGADVGAIFSVYVAAFVVYQAWASEGPKARNLTWGIGRVVVIAGFAAFLAAQTISVLVGTQIKGVAGAQQDTQSKWERWDWATQWSLPKREALGLVVPGLFGYRMDTPVGLPESMQEAYTGGQYWGYVGMDPSWYRYWKNQGPRPGGAPRGFSGGGIYAGMLVILVGIWAAVQSFRKKDSVYSPPTRRLLWFWTGVVVVSLLLSFGRFAPFYQLVYALPYFSTIRNPGKFLFPLSWAMIVLFAYGADGLWRRYMQSTPAGTAALGFFQRVKTWWRGPKGFDQRWARWGLASLGAAALGWLILASSRQGFEKYLQDLQYEPSMAAAIASFSSGQIGRSVLFLALAILLMTLVLSGALSGHRGKWGAILLGLFLFIDLGRANRPWVIVWDHTSKYATDPIVEMLRKEPYEHRAAGMPRWLTGVLRLPDPLARNEAYVAQYYSIEWAQHHFLYYNIQSLDVIQMPRMPEDLLAYEMNFSPRSDADLWMVARKWELTNTRYIIAAAGFLDFLNQSIDSGKGRFRIAERFSIVPKPGFVPEKINQLQQLTAVTDTNGPFAVFDFTGALPRAKLYSNWDVATNDPQMVGQLLANVQQWSSQRLTNAVADKELRSLEHMGTNDYLTLKTLASPGFDPANKVLLAAPLPGTGTNAPQAAGKVEFTSYAPKDIVLKAEVAAPSVLLLNDHYDPNWQVRVDGQPETLLRCNYLMRGVHLQPGIHTVEFRFRPSMGGFYVSLAAIGLGIVLCGILLVWRKPGENGQPPADSPQNATAQKS